MQLQRLHRVINLDIAHLVSILFLILADTTVNAAARKTNPNLFTLSLELQDELVRSDAAQLKVLADELAVELNRSSSDFEYATWHRVSGSYYMKAGNPRSGIHHLNKALNYFIQIEDYGLSARIANDIANCYLLLSTDVAASYYYKLSMFLGKLSNDPEDEHIAKINLARLHASQGNLNQAEQFANEYLTVAKKFKKYESVSDAYGLLFEIKLKSNKKGEALIQLRNSLKYAELTDSDVLKSNWHLNSAILNFENGALNESKTHFHKALEIRLKLNNRHLICDAYYNLGAFYLFQENWDSARVYFNNDLELALANDLYRDAEDALLALVELSKLKGKEDEGANKELAALRKQVEREAIKFEETHDEVAEIEPKEGISFLLYLFIPIPILFALIRRYSK